MHIVFICVYVCVYFGGIAIVSRVDMINHTGSGKNNRAQDSQVLNEAELNQLKMNALCGVYNSFTPNITS